MQKTVFHFLIFIIIIIFNVFGTLKVSSIYNERFQIKVE